MLSFLCNSCASKKESLAKPEESNIYIQLLDEDTLNNYRVYLNFKDTNRSLNKYYITKFTVGLGDTNIQIVKKRKTASIDLNVQKGAKYYFNVFTSIDKELIILQRAKK